MKNDRRDARSRIPELSFLIEPLLGLSAARRAAPLIYLELEGLERATQCELERVRETCSRAVAGVLRDAVGSLLRRHDCVAAGPGGHWFVALLVDRAVAAAAREQIADADLGTIALRLRAAGQARLDAAEREHALPVHVALLAGWTVVEPVAPDRPLEELRHAIRGAAVVGRVHQRRATLLAAMGHELRTPLTSIIGYAERLRSDAALTPAKREHYAVIVEQESRRLQRLVENLISLESWSAGNLKLGRVPVNLREIAERAWIVLQSSSVRNVRWAVHGNAEISADRERVLQMLINLFDNARRYAKPNGAVRLNIRRRDGTCSLVVIDNGPGFDAQARRAFGTPFGTGARGKLGLGLLITRMLAEAHGGSVALGSGPSGGARVTVKLPV